MPLLPEGPAVVPLAEVGKGADVSDKLDAEVGRLEPPDAGKDVGVYSRVEEPPVPVGKGTLEPVGPAGLEELVNGKGSAVSGSDELSGPILMLMEISGLAEVDDVVPPEVGFAVSEAEMSDVVDTGDVVLSKDVELEVLEGWLLEPEDDASVVVVEFNVGDAETLPDSDTDELDNGGADELYPEEEVSGDVDEELFVNPEAVEVAMEEVSPLSGAVRLASELLELTEPVELDELVAGGVVEERVVVLDPYASVSEVSEPVEDGELEVSDPYPNSC